MDRTDPPPPTHLVHRPLAEQQQEQQGAGDALPFTPDGGRTVLLSGYSFRSDAGAATELATLFGCPVRPVPPRTVKQNTDRPT